MRRSVVCGICNQSAYALACPAPAPRPRALANAFSLLRDAPALAPKGRKSKQKGRKSTRGSASGQSQGRWSAEQGEGGGTEQPLGATVPPLAASASAPALGRESHDVDRDPFALQRPTLPPHQLEPLQLSSTRTGGGIRNPDAPTPLALVGLNAAPGDGTGLRFLSPMGARPTPDAAAFRMREMEGEVRIGLR